MTTTETVPLKRYTVDIEVKIKIGTAPEDKRAIFEDLKNALPDSHRHYADFFTVRAGVTCFRFILSAVSAESALGGARIAAYLYVPIEYPYEVFLGE
jgi:hypothetical protein